MLTHLASLHPLCYKDATEKEERQQVMLEEMKAIKKNGTWEMTDLPEGKNAIGLKSAFMTNFSVDGSIQKHKA